MLSSCSKSDQVLLMKETDEYQIANGYYYWSTEQKIPLWPDDSYYLVQLKAGHKASDLDSPFKEKIVVAAEDRIILDKANFNAFNQAHKQLIEKAIPTYKMKDGYSLKVGNWASQALNLSVSRLLSSFTFFLCCLAISFVSPISSRRLYNSNF